MATHTSVDPARALRPGRRRGIRRAALVAMIVVTGSACANLPVARGNTVLLVGDSILASARSAVSSTLRAAGWDPRVEAQAGTTIGFWVDRIAVLEAAMQPGVLVVELGTNDCLRDCAPLGPAIDAIMSTVPSSQPVLWLTVEEGIPAPFANEAEYVNTLLQTAAARWPNFSLVDYGGHFAGHPEWHAPDRVHLNDAGIRELAQLIATELNRVRPPP